MAKPTVFIGSSSEGLEIARAIKLQLEDDAQISIWDEDVFDLSQSTLESLVKALDSFDFAVLVITSDDAVVSRETKAQAPRDNIIFEFGLFMGGLGRDRTFGVCSDDTAMKLPSDLLGVALARYDAVHAQQDPDSAVRPAGSQIRRAIDKHGCRAGLEKSPEEKLADTYSQIEFDFGGLASEIEREFRTSLQEWRTVARVYIEQCRYYQKATMEQLTEAVSVHRHLRQSVDRVQELVLNAITTTILTLDKKPRSKAKCKEQFNHAAKGLRSMAKQINDHAHRVITED